MKVLYTLGYSGYSEPFRHLFDEGLTIKLGSMPGKRSKDYPDMVLFCGGQDISPSLYGEDYEPYGEYEEVRQYYKGYISERDRWEKAWFNFALAHSIPMFGTCRGMQMFTVLTGGKLIQHVEGHHKSHSVYSPTSNKRFMVNSIHHQMCVPKEGEYELLAWSSKVAGPTYEVEPEALYFPKVRALGVQWHPEGMNEESEAHQFVMQQLKEKLCV